MSKFMLTAIRTLPERLLDDRTKVLEWGGPGPIVVAIHPDQRPAVYYGSDCLWRDLICRHTPTPTPAQV